MLTGIKKVHFVGIGGAGMSALAKILVEKGYQISGSDVKESAMTGVLRKLGATVYIGQKAENVQGAEAIVVSTAIREENPEVVEAKRLGLRRLHRSDVNAFLINNCKGIAVAGAHGKTTTTSMLGVSLDYEGVSPSIIIGGEVDYLGSNAKLGQSDYLVSEADESDGTFLKYYPYVGIVTNVENDHMDHYGTMENIIKAFTQFLNQVRPEGFAVVCFDNENIRNIVKHTKTRYISYAINHEADYQAVDIVTDVDCTSFRVVHEGVNMGLVRLSVPGRHNVLNAMATIVTGLELGLSLEQMAEGLTMFHGAKRRFQTKGKRHGVWVVDDYAHHPTEIETTLRAARQTKPKRLICAFQPHRYSRTQLLQKEYGSCFRQADLLILTDVYSAGEDPIPGVDGELLVKEVAAQTGQQAVYIKDKAEIAKYLYSISQPGDLIMTMGAGDIVKCGEELVDIMKASKTKIMVVMGGPSTEAEVSRRSGSAILQALQDKGYNAQGLELDPINFANNLKESGAEFVFNAIHGKFGEDGILQGTCEMLGIPYTSSGVLAAAVTMDKVATKRFLQAQGIPTPKYAVLHRDGVIAGKAEFIKKEFGLPVVIKAASQGSSIGVVIVEQESELEGALQEAFKYDAQVLVEEFIKGRELTVAVFCSEEEQEALPIIEITTETGRYDYETKYKVGASHHIIPAPLSDLRTEQVKAIAELACDICGCRGVARVDFMLDEAENPYAIEINTVPGMTETSLVPDAARAIGMEFPELCAKILEMAGYHD